MQKHIVLKFLSTLLISLVLTFNALALVDSHKNFPTKVANWIITSHHMDTGDLRGCTAQGKFGDLDVNIGNPLGPNSSDISFRFVKNRSTPGPANPGDQRDCGSGKNQASSGSWHYSSSHSSDEFCDGKAWLKPEEGHFKKAALLLNGTEVATAQESADFRLGLISGKLVLFEYSAWFQRIDGLEKKLSRPGKVELRIEGLKYGPISLADLHMDKVLAELVRCARERK